MRISVIHIIFAVSAGAWAAPSSVATGSDLNVRSNSALNPRVPVTDGETSRPSSPVPDLEDDDAEEDPEPDKPAYVSSLKKVEEVDNDEDYNKADRKEFKKIFKSKKGDSSDSDSESNKDETSDEKDDKKGDKKDKKKDGKKDGKKDKKKDKDPASNSDIERRRDLHRRNPVKFHVIKNAKDMLYYKAYAALNPSKQRIFYGKKDGDEIKFYKGTNANKPPGLGEMHIDHRLEIQRMKNLFKREQPEGVKDAAWKKMQVATAEDTNSDTNEDKKTLAEVINDTANLRGLQEDPNLVKGKVSMYIDKKFMGKPTSSEGPDYAKSWARSHAYVAFMYLKATRRQYNAVAKSLADAAFEITKDEKLKDYVLKELKKLDLEDAKTLKEALETKVEKDGVNFKEEDMKKVPKL